jgi:hypothetical protein
MAVITIGSSWTTGDQPTAAVLNAKWTNATFASGAVDGSTTDLSSGAIIVKDLGVSAAKLATDAVTTAKIADLNVTEGKIAANAVTVAKMATTLDFSSNTLTLPAGNVTFAQVATAAVAEAAEVAAETSSKLVAANLMINHPGIAKCWGVVDESTFATTDSYNVTAAVDGGEGIVNITIPEMANTNYVVVATNQATDKDHNEVVVHTKTTTSFKLEVANTGNKINFVVYGDLA